MQHKNKKYRQKKYKIYRYIILQDGVLMANRSSPVPRFLLAGLHNNSTLILRWDQDDDHDDNDLDDHDDDDDHQDDDSFCYGGDTHI